MGDAPSKTGSQDASATQAQARQLHESFLYKSLDGKSAIESVFANDPAALEEISKIVAELEGNAATDHGTPSERKHAEERARVLQARARKLNAGVKKKAEVHADRWLERELQQGLAAAAEAKARKLTSTTEARTESTTPVVAQATNQNTSEKQAAKYEQEARADLWANAGRTNSKYAASCSIGLCLQDLTKPMPPIEPEVDGSVPTLPALPTQVSNARAVPEFYELLGIPVDATFDEVKKGYRREALSWHPDKNRDRTEEAAERFKRISEAFDTLYDPERRASYDSGALPAESRRLKKLAGHGWSSLADEDDLTLTPQGLKWKKQSWRGYVLMYGRLDDNPEDVIQDDSDPRAPEVKLKVFWRFLAEMVHLDRESGVDLWMDKFISKVWKDTPSKWPKALELQSMSEAAQQEWKERRLVFSRRRQKLRVHIQLHEQYLAIPDRERKEVERISQRNPVWVRSFGMDIGAGMERTGANKADRSSSHLRM